jgi:hypothetical protein
MAHSGQRRLQSWALPAPVQACSRIMRMSLQPFITQPGHSGRPSSVNRVYALSTSSWMTRCASKLCRRESRSLLAASPYSRSSAKVVNHSGDRLGKPVEGGVVGELARDEPHTL